MIAYIVLFMSGIVFGFKIFNETRIRRLKND